MRPQIPERLQHREKHKGYPVPWFAQYVDGVPDFRLMDMEKLIAAVRFKRCWICGEPLDSEMTFVTVPSSGFVRNAPEPPCHHECAEFSAKVCPHLAMPKSKRRPVAGAVFMGEHDLTNEGMAMLWTTRSYRTCETDDHAIVFLMGDPLRVEFFKEGRRAAAAEALEVIDREAPWKRRLAEMDGLAPLFEAGYERLRALA